MRMHIIQSSRTPDDAVLLLNYLGEPSGFKKTRAIDLIFDKG